MQHGRWRAGSSSARPAGARSRVSRGLAASVVGAVLPLGLFALGCGGQDASSSSSDGVATVKLGQVGPAIAVLPDYVAEAEGFYAKHRIKVRRMTVATVQPALIAGQIDVANSTADAAITAAAAGKPLPILVPYQEHGTQNLMIRKDLDKPSLHAPYPANLQALPRPLSVALVVRGSSADVLLQSIMTGAGLKEGKDFRPIVISGGPNVVAALKAKQVQAAVLFPPFDALAEQQGIAVSVNSEAAGQGPGELLARYGGALAANPAWVSKNPDVAKRLVAALVDAERYIYDAYAKNDAAKQARLLAIAKRYTKVSDAEAAKRSLETIAKLTNPTVDCARIEQQAKLLISSVGTLKSAPNCKDVMLDGYVPKAAFG